VTANFGGCCLRDTAAHGKVPADKTAPAPAVARRRPTGSSPGRAATGTAFKRKVASMAPLRVPLAGRLTQYSSGRVRFAWRRDAVGLAAGEPGPDHEPRPEDQREKADWPGRAEVPAPVGAPGNIPISRNAEIDAQGKRPRPVMRRAYAEPSREATYN
jgi:hypothetical protein